MPFYKKTVLLAWELGEGLGHLPPLKAIALGLQPYGVRPVFALRDTVGTRATLKETGGVILQAPFWPNPKPPQVLSHSYADILAGNGYGAAETARTLIAGWDVLIDQVKPDLVVCEHAPGAALAAFGRVPVALVGNGFVVPPADGEAFAAYEPGRGEPGRQGPVLRALQEAFAELNRAAPTSICEAFRGAFRGIYSYPELDTYGHVRREPVLGPIELPPALTPLPATRQVFFYSTSELAMIDALSHSVMEIGPQARVYFRGSPGARAAVLRSRGVRVDDEAPALAEVLPEASVVFSHGGTGFSNAALASGRPHIVYPRHYEARSTARELEALGCGICIDPFDGQLFREAVKRAHGDTAMREAAQKAGAAAQAFVARSRALEATLMGLRALLA